MNVIRIDAIDDPRLAGYVHIGDEHWLTRQGWFAAEGRFVVERLATARPESVLSVLANEAALAALEPALKGLDAPIFLCAPRFFERLSGHHFHRGCLALAKRPERADAHALASRATALVVLDRVADAVNVGSVFRSALAFGVDALWLGPGCADPLSRRAIRTSMAATLRVPYAQFESTRAAESPELPWPGCLDTLAGAGFRLLALSPRQPATDLSREAASAAGYRFALLVGSEGSGLSPEAEAAATARLCIPMRPGVDSLNLGVAAGIALHWLLRR